MLTLLAGCSGGSGPVAASESPTATATASPSSTPRATPTADPLAAFYHQHLAWSSCHQQFQCATLSVPLDYRHPQGRRIGIAVIRLPAADPAHRIGSLLWNPGGPGVSGYEYTLYAQDAFDQTIRDHFDIVGFDPRGVGRSAPVSCLSNAQLDAYVHVDPIPDVTGELADMVSWSKRFAAACEAQSGWLLPYVSTLYQARDMDVLRAALGDPKLTYIGFSYGTFLGAKYAQQFPTRIRALVLDGALDPTTDTNAVNRVQALGFETDLKDFLSDCVRRSSCPFHGTEADAERQLDALFQRVDDHPIPVGSRSLGPGEFFNGLADGLYSGAAGYDRLRAALATAAQGGGAALLELNDSIVERDSSGQYSNLIVSNMAINCVDRPSPRDVSSYAQVAQQLQAQAPLFGPAIAWSSLPCAYWPAPAVETTHPVVAGGAPPIVVIGTTRDPATPYVWAQHLAQQLSSGVLVTFNSDGHTAYNRGSSCINNAVDAYLVSLTVPHGLYCSA